MYAVIETGGKQYRVEVGMELEVELLDVEPGKTVTLDRVLLVADGDESTIGRPMVDGAAVSAEVVRQARGDKVISFKYRPKARRRVKKGHRQELTILRISDIVFGGKSAAKVAAKAETDAKTERQRLEEAAVVQAAKDAELAAKLAASATPTKTKPTKTKAEAAESPAEAVEAKPAATKPAAKKPEATAKPKPAAKKPVAKAKAADEADPADAPAETAPKQRAPRRATKKDE